MTPEEFTRCYGRYLSKERAPNGDLQIDGRFTRDLLRTLAVERRGYGALLRLDALRMELFGEFLAEARAALDEMEQRDERVETYR